MVLSVILTINIYDIDGLILSNLYSYVIE